MREPLERGVEITPRMSLKMSMGRRPRPRSFVPPRKMVRWGGWAMFEGEEPGGIFSGEYANCISVNISEKRHHKIPKRKENAMNSKQWVAIFPDWDGSSNF